MLAVYLAPFYIIWNIYLLRWILKWLGACARPLKRTWVRAAVILGYSFFALAMVAAFFLPEGMLRRALKLIGNYWLGVLLYLSLTIAVADVLRLILRRVKKIDQEKLRSRRSFVIGGTICLIVTGLFTTWGVINARIVRVTPYEITVDKDGGKISKLKVVLAADLHLGYNIGVFQMTQMVEKINAQSPDLVVFAGDIFDNEYEAVGQPEKLIQILRGINSKYGVYACYGNHDIQEPILAGFTFGGDSDRKVSDVRMDEFLEKAGITLLQDEYVLIEDSFYLYGRPDLERLGRGIGERKTPEEITAGLDQTKPILVIDHEPRELAELADAGVDVDLCGHTHDGQLFPGNLTIKLMWENPCGYLKVGEMHNIVTSGVGLFGPNMRVGTRAEICPVTVRFEER